MGITVESAMKKKSPKMKKRFRAATGDGTGNPPKKGMSTGAMWTIGIVVTGVIIGVVIYLKRRNAAPKTNFINKDAI